jgi:hypothetical protein
VRFRLLRLAGFRDCNAGHAGPSLRRSWSAATGRSG